MDDDKVFEWDTDTARQRVLHEWNISSQNTMFYLLDKREKLNAISVAARIKHENFRQRLRDKVANWFSFAKVWEISPEFEYYKDKMCRYTAIHHAEKQRFSLENEAHKAELDLFSAEALPFLRQKIWKAEVPFVLDNLVSVAREEEVEIEQRMSHMGRQISDINDTSG